MPDHTDRIAARMGAEFVTRSVGDGPIATFLERYAGLQGAREAKECLTALEARVAELEEKNARLLDRMSDMMPIAGGNPMKQRGGSCSTRT